MPFASYVMQATCFFTIGFCLARRCYNWHGGKSVPTKEAAAGGRRRDFVGLFAYLARRLLVTAGESTRYPALERIFVVIAIAAGISALLLLPLWNAQTPREA